ncbi:MAG: homocysteine S-methyltransferase family protein, partial [Syntrophales bacterium]|nr:homocysteine S-methyltransferase family protein [Syntrophales bacterium]
DILYTCTFGANRFKFSQYQTTNVRKVNRELAILARKAAGKGALIAGDIGPTGQFIEPFGSLPFEEAVEAFKEQIQGLLEGGVDLFAIETMMDIQEARAALLAVKETSSSYFTIVTMTYEKNGRTLNGADTVTALITQQSLGADAVGSNCSTGPDMMMGIIAAMKPYATVPLVAKPNAGIPRLVGRDTVFDMDASTFAAFGTKFAASGINMMGGCCGTTPAHIAALKEDMKNEQPLAPRRKSLSALSSAFNFTVLDRDKPLFIIGERLNPTGKSALQQELLEGKMSLVRRLAKEQEEKGADLLDVNVGVPGIDEVKAIRDILRLLSTTVGLPLVIDSSRVETIEAALRLYPGRALVNSISGEREKLDKLLPVAAKYGAMFILLPLTDAEIPETAEGRKPIIKSVFQAAKRFGFTKDDIIIDGLVMTAASNPSAALEALKTVAWGVNQFKCRTLLGLSNISFGMPGRKWIDASLLAMGQASGLTMAIANPENTEIMRMKTAGDLLTGKDRDASSYIASFSDGQETDKTTIPAEDASPAQKVRRAILEGNREDILPLVEDALISGMNAATLVDDIMIPAIIMVGELFNEKKYFLPQLIASGEAMKKALGRLEPEIKNDNVIQERKGVVLLATVKGDIHDIGKNIVALLLKNHGYAVIDIGKDLPAEAIVEAAKQTRPDVIGLSALMTTTMVNMKDVIDFAKREGIRCRFILGGAVMTASYAASLGAAYAKDGVDAVRVIEQLVREK